MVKWTYLTLSFFFLKNSGSIFLYFSCRHMCAYVSEMQFLWLTISSPAITLFVWSSKVPIHLITPYRGGFPCNSTSTMDPTTRSGSGGTEEVVELDELCFPSLFLSKDSVQIYRCSIIFSYIFKGSKLFKGYLKKTYCWTSGMRWKFYNMKGAFHTSVHNAIFFLALFLFFLTIFRNV